MAEKDRKLYLGAAAAVFGAFLGLSYVMWDYAIGTMIELQQRVTTLEHVCK